MTGTVSWGAPVASRPVQVTTDRHVCGLSGLLLAPEIAVDERGRVAEAVVYVETSTAAKKKIRYKSQRPAPVIFDQRNCAFVPHVAAASTGAQVRFRNSDAVFHNVHARMDTETVANYSMPIQGQEIAAFRAKKSGTITLRCDAGHTWMEAYLMVFEHPLWAVTGAGGRFTIEGVPDGEHRLVIWHPELGRIVRKIRTEGRTRLEVDATF